jgi:hypothetical protein
VGAFFVWKNFQFAFIKNVWSSDIVIGPP